VTDDDTAFFGHPRGLAYLAFTQVWERFSFYGMQALLTLYMVNQLLLPGHVEHVLGFAAFRSALEGVFGSMTRLALASQIFGLYVGGTYLTPLLGAWLGDRVLGQRRTAILGLAMMTAGHFLMASEAAFLLALVLLLLGAGCMKGNLYTQVGNLYSGDDARRPRAFGVYLIALNLGAFFAPLVCGTLGELYGWHYGFGVAGIGMLMGLGIFLAGQRYLPPDRMHRDGPKATLQRDDWRAIGAIIVMLVPTVVIYSATQQAYNLLIVWAERHVDREVLGSAVPVTWLLTFDGLMTIVGVFLAIRLWRWLVERGREPDTILKLAIGGGLVAVAYALLGWGMALWAAVPLLVVLLFFTIMDLSFGWLDPPANAFVSRFAPATVVTTMMSINLMAFGIANVVAGWLGRFYEPLGAARFWHMHAVIAAAGTVLVLASRPVIAALLSRPRAAGAAASTAY
jgi:POT family proton-dependent oligopeptide transporter